LCVFLLTMLLAATSIDVAEAQPRWSDVNDWRWNNVFSDTQSYKYVSEPLQIDNGLAELTIKIEEDGDFTFNWMKEGGSETYLRFFINNDEADRCNEAVLTQSRRSYPVKNGSILRWRFTAKVLGHNQTATVVIPKELGPTHIINKPSIVEIYNGFRLNNSLFIASGVRCSQRCKPIVDFSAVDTQKPGNYTYSIKCNEIGPVQETGIITVLPLDFIDAPSSSCVRQSGLYASVSKIAGANYYWTLNGGEITSGQGNSKIQWTSGNSRCNLSVIVNLSGFEKNLSRNVPVDPTCIYCDGLRTKNRPSPSGTKPIEFFVNSDSELRDAINNSSFNKMIYLKDNEFRGSYYINNTAGTIKITSDPCNKKRPILRNNGDYVIAIEDSPYVSIEELEISDAKNGILMEDSWKCNITNCSIKNFTLNAISLINSSASIQINKIIFNSSQNHIAGINLVKCRDKCTIIDNEIILASGVKRGSQGPIDLSLDQCQVRNQKFKPYDYKNTSLILKDGIYWQINCSSTTPCCRRKNAEACNCSEFGSSIICRSP